MPNYFRLINTLNLILELTLLSVVPFFSTWAIMKFILHRNRAKTVAIIVTIIVFAMMFAVAIARDYQISKSYHEKLREENAKTDMEISSFKQIIEQAITTNDSTLCNSIPKPTHYGYRFDDYNQSAPSQEDWTRDVGREPRPEDPIFKKEGAILRRTTPIGIKKRDSIGMDRTGIDTLVVLF